MTRGGPLYALRNRQSLSRRTFLRGTATMAALTLAAGASASADAGAATTHLPAAARANNSAAQADALLTDLVTRRLFRGSVLVAQHGHVVLSKGYDAADTVRRVPNTPRTRFRIASITKQFTAMAILQLQDQGKLHVHAPLSVYLSPCPAAWRAITLHQLLTHTSGIPDYTNLPAYSSLRTRALTPAELIALFRDRPLDFPPGTRWSYSNSGYVLLGYLIDQLSGMPYGRFLQRYIFMPVQMRDTGEGRMPPAAGPYATGYASWQRPAIYERCAFADGDLYSTVEDLYRWDQAVTTGRPALVTAQGLRSMFTPYVPTDPAFPHSGAYGYGWFIGHEGTHREIEHTGDISGFLSANQLYPDDHLTVIVLSNLESDQGLRSITIALAGITLGYTDCATLRLPCAELS